MQALNNGFNTYSYSYDKNGNIEKITEGTSSIDYVYNEVNELIRENNGVLNKTIVYSYDAGGNILSKKEYPYATGTLGTLTSTINYGYDATWKDKLTSYNGKSITYDQLGNPLTYDNYTYTWEMGRQLKSISGNGKTLSFKYNDAGIRTEKTANGVTTKYHLLGDKVAYENNGTDKIYYTYDSAGHLLSMNLNGVEYYYIRNNQGDIIGLFDKNGATVASYTYDSWGKLVSIDGTMKDTVGVKNPYRYRGYRYDTENGLYYLQSRYYNPEWGRFINSDGLVGKRGELLGHNLFAYCKNNPINRRDSSGFRSVRVDFEDTDDSANQAEGDNSKPKEKLGFNGEPNSHGVEYGDDGELVKERWYGPDRRPIKDRHHTNHGNPQKHPVVPHDHDWRDVDGKWEPGDWYDPLLGAGLVLAAGVATIVIVADDATGIGFLDDWLIAPLSGAVGKGLTMIFGG